MTFINTNLVARNWFSLRVSIYIWCSIGKISLFLELICAHLCILIIKINILILGEGSTQGLDDTTSITETNILLILHNQSKDLY